MSKKIPEGCRRVQLTCTLIVPIKMSGVRHTQSKIKERVLNAFYAADLEAQAVKLSELDEK